MFLRVGAEDYNGAFGGNSAAECERVVLNCRVFIGTLRVRVSKTVPRTVLEERNL